MDSDDEPLAQKSARRLGKQHATPAETPASINASSSLPNLPTVIVTSPTPSQHSTSSSSQQSTSNNAMANQTQENHPQPLLKVGPQPINVIPSDQAGHELNYPAETINGGLQSLWHRTRDLEVFGSTIPDILRAIVSEGLKKHGEDLKKHIGDDIKKHVGEEIKKHVENPQDKDSIIESLKLQVAGLESRTLSLSGVISEFEERAKKHPVTNSQWTQTSDFQVDALDLDLTSSKVTVGEVRRDSLVDDSCTAPKQGQNDDAEGSKSDDSLFVSPSKLTKRPIETEAGALPSPKRLRRLSGSLPPQASHTQSLGTSVLKPSHRESETEASKTTLGKSAISKPLVNDARPSLFSDLSRPRHERRPSGPQGRPQTSAMVPNIHPDFNFRDRRDSSGDSNTRSSSSPLKKTVANLPSFTLPQKKDTAVSLLSSSPQKSRAATPSPSLPQKPSATISSSSSSTQKRRAVDLSSSSSPQKKGIAIPALSLQRKKARAADSTSSPVPQKKGVAVSLSSSSPQKPGPRNALPLSSPHKKGVANTPSSSSQQKSGAVATSQSSSSSPKVGAEETSQNEGFQKLTLQQYIQRKNV